MKRYLWLALFALSLSAFGQSSSGNLTASSAACATTNSCVVLVLPLNSGSGAIQITGTFTSTVQFEASVDGGLTWASVLGTQLGSTTTATSATAAGRWRFNIGGLTHLRVRCSSYASGTVSVVIQSALVSAGLAEGDPATSPGSPDTSVQFNDGGVFGGDAGVTLNKTTHAITATTFSGALSGNASTATALAANGTNCSAGQAPLGVDAAGNSESCTAYQTPILSGSTGSIGGGLLTAGACTSGTASVTGATTAMTATASPVTYPGDGNLWLAYVSDPDVVTVEVCAILTLTPTASIYRVRVIP